MQTVSGAKDLYVLPSTQSSPATGSGVVEEHRITTVFALRSLFSSQQEVEHMACFNLNK